jgi:uncharacterized protein (TIGR00251 family)
VLSSVGDKAGNQTQFGKNMTAPSPNEVKISLRIQPGASRNEVAGFTSGVWKIKIAAPPVEGKANKELTLYLSEVLNIARSRIAIVRGETGRDKVVAVYGLTADEIEKRLSARIQR